VIEPFAEGGEAKISDKTSSPQLPHPAQILGHIFDVVQNLAKRRPRRIARDCQQWAPGSPCLPPRGSRQETSIWLAELPGC
jgi:hypothetical protein